MQQQTDYEPRTITGNKRPTIKFEEMKSVNGQTIVVGKTFDNDLTQET